MTPLPAPSTYGLITGTIEGLATCRSLVGGDGEARWKQLLMGMHLAGRWNTVEYVKLPRGASCGEHLHDGEKPTEEIYDILSGTAMMQINGRPVPVAAGDLVTAPIGTRHAIAGTSSAPMAFLVTEVFPGEAAERRTWQRLHVRDALSPQPGYRGSGVTACAATVDLAPLFTGPWAEFHEILLDPGMRFSPAPSDGITEVAFAVSGQCRFDSGDATMTGAGWYAGIPPGTRWSAWNAPGAPEPARLVTVGVNADAPRP